MHHKLKAVPPLIGLFFTGCDLNGTTSVIEGDYIQCDTPGISLKIKDGQYWRGSADSHLMGTYTIRPRGADGFELKVTLIDGELRGIKITVTIRRDGDFIFVTEDGQEIKFQRH